MKWRTIFFFALVRLKLGSRFREENFSNYESIKIYRVRNKFNYFGTKVTKSLCIKSMYYFSSMKLHQPCFNRNLHDPLSFNAASKLEFLFDLLVLGKKSEQLINKPNNRRRAVSLMSKKSKQLINKPKENSLMWIVTNISAVVGRL